MCDRYFVNTDMLNYHVYITSDKYLQMTCFFFFTHCLFCVYLFLYEYMQPEGNALYICLVCFFLTFINNKSWQLFWMKSVINLYNFLTDCLFARSPKTRIKSYAPYFNGCFRPWCFNGCLLCINTMYGYLRPKAYQYVIPINAMDDYLVCWLVIMTLHNILIARQP